MLFVRVVDRLTMIAVAISAALVAFLMLAQVTEVILRSIGRPTTWAYDLSLSALLGVIFLGLAAAEGAHEHVAVDSLPLMLGKRWQAAIRLFNGVASLAFLGLVIWAGVAMAATSISQGRQTGGLFSMPSAIPESLLPIGAFLLALQIVARLISPRPSAADDVGRAGGVAPPGTEQ
jgi:C4-dicarboxylate transporter DctQ subunit